MSGTTHVPLEAPAAIRPRSNRRFLTVLPLFQGAACAECPNAAFARHVRALPHLKLRPVYLFRLKTMAINIKTAEDIAGLRVAGRLASELLDYLTPFVKPGVTTAELDKLAYDYTVNVQQCIPACLGYQPPGMTPYPATSCISINHVVCHGIPSEKKLKAGDIVNIDVTSIKDGYHGDTSRMFVVGKPTIAGKRLAQLAFEIMWAGIDVVKPGAHFNDIGVACQAYADRNGVSVVRDYGGHGIGKGFHEEPHVNHFPVNRPTAVMEPGMVFTVEPMVNAGRYGVTMLGDGWTVVTEDSSVCSHYEHTIVINENGLPELLSYRGFALTEEEE